MNLHFKDTSGKHRIVEGDRLMLDDQRGLKKFLSAQGLHCMPRTPVLGVINGGGSRHKMRSRPNQAPSGGLLA